MYCCILCECTAHQPGAASCLCNRAAFCMSSPWFPLSGPLSALLAKTITHKLNNHLTQRAKLLMRRPYGLIKWGLGCKQVCSAKAALPLRANQKPQLLSSHCCSSCDFIGFHLLTGRVWCKRTTRTKGKNLHILHPYWPDRFTCPFLLIPPPHTLSLYWLNWFQDHFECTLYHISRRETRVRQDFQASQAQRVQKGSLVPGVYLALLGPQAPLEEALCGTLRYWSACTVAQLVISSFIRN